MADTMPEIPPEVPDWCRGRLERTWREAPERFASELATLLNVLRKDAPRSFAPKEAPSDDERDRWHP